MEDTDYLRDVDQDKAFWFRHGVSVRNIYELQREIHSMTDTAFLYHCNDKHDDFANWIGGVIGDISLSYRLRKVKDKQKYVKAIEHRIKSLERERTHLQTSRLLSERFYALFRNYGYAWIILILIVLSSIFTAILFFNYNSLRSINALNQKLEYLETMNGCFNNYFNEQLIKTKELINTTKGFEVENYCVLNYSTYLRPTTPELEEKPPTFMDKDIHVQDDKVVIDAKNIMKPVIANTSSMLPVINHNTRVLEMTPRIDELNVGDIISFHDEGSIVIHRIIDIGYDDEGFFAVTKGDNNPYADTKKVRFDDINGKVVMLIY